MKTKRDVCDNIFYSSNPKINIKINPDFTYTRSDTKHEYGHDAAGGAEQQTGIKKESYIFYNRELKRLIDINILKLTTERWSWHPNHFKWVKNKLDSGTVEINGKKYQYCVYVDTSSSGACWLVKGLGRIISAESDSKINIFYAQELGGKYKCSYWENVNSLAHIQKTLLDEFIESSKKDIQILKEYSLPDCAVTKSG